MRGKYKRHHWPEDPLNAEATTKSKKFEDGVARRELEAAREKLQQQNQQAKKQPQKSGKKK
jgi:hypothetical protein